MLSWQVIENAVIKYSHTAVTWNYAVFKAN